MSARKTNHHHKGPPAISARGGCHPGKGGRMKSKLTSTRLTTLRKCPRLHFLRYELGFAPIRTATPLRFGGGFHAGMEAYNRGANNDTVMQWALADYEAVPQWADPTDWAVE